MGFEGEAVRGRWDQGERRGGGDCFDDPSEVFVALNVDEYLCDVSVSITCRKKLRTLIIEESVMESFKDLIREVLQLPFDFYLSAWSG